MSGRITDASQRRMDEREHFAELTPGPYFDIMGPDGLPRLTIRIQGRPQSSGFAESVADGIEQWVADHAQALHVTRRKTA